MRFKFNSGQGAILCENCAVIIASGHHIPTNLSQDKYYFCCEKCKEEFIKANPLTSEQCVVLKIKKNKT